MIARLAKATGPGPNVGTDDSNAPSSDIDIIMLDIDAGFSARLPQPIAYSLSEFLFDRIAWFDKSPQDFRESSTGGEGPS